MWNTKFTPMSMEDLGMDAPAEPVAAPIPAGVPIQPDGKPQKNKGNLPSCQPCMDGYISELPNPNGGKIYHCSITQVVEDCAPYYALIKLFWTANEDDNIVLDIFSYGGQVETGCHIIAGMLHTKAKVTTIAYGLCCSIGAMIWACGHNRRVTDNATIMFHMPSGGVFGKTADNMEESKNIQDWFTEFMTEVSKGILTSAELNDIIECRQDHFIPASVMKERLQAIASQGFSAEGLQACIVNADNRKWNTNVTRYSKEAYQQKGFGQNLNCIFDMAPPKPRQLIFTRDELPDNRVAWTFFLTEFVTERMAKDFVCKMLLPSDKDIVLIHAPSELDLDSSEVLSSAVQQCKADVTISAPYILNTAAAFFATSGNNLIPFSYGISVLNLPPVAAYGKVIDADNSVRMHKTRILHFLNTLRKYHFIDTEEAFLHIVKKQGAYCIFGKKLAEIIKSANAIKQENK